MLEIQKKPAEELRKSMHSQIANPEHKPLFWDRVSDKFGSENLAYIIMILSNLFWPIAFIYTNENYFNIYETALVRAIAVIVLNVFIARMYKIDMTFQDPKNFRILFIRNLIITLQGLVYTIVQFFLTQPIILTINATGPLFIFLMDYKINGVKISMDQLKGVGLGIVGVLLTVNGDMVYNLIDPTYVPTSDFEYLSYNPMVKLVFALIFVVTQMAWGYAQVITKQLNGVNSIQINIHLGLFILFSTGIIYPIKVVHQVSIEKIIISIFASGLLMAISQILFIGAITMTKNTGQITMLIFTGVIIGYFISIFRYNEQVNIISTIGTILIIIGLAKIILKKKQQVKPIEQA